jgi:hypothetical protein
LGKDAATAPHCGRQEQQRLSEPASHIRTPGFDRQGVAVPLEEEFHAQLDEPGRRRANDLTERRATDVSIHCLRPEKLGVVEGIESFEPELQ